jgi:hypothetical protein
VVADLDGISLPQQVFGVGEGYGRFGSSSRQSSEADSRMHEKNVPFHIIILQILEEVQMPRR